MGEALPVDRTDRLPWIDFVEEAKARRDARSRRGAGWLVVPAGIAAFAGALFWVGQQGGNEDGSPMLATAPSQAGTAGADPASPAPAAAATSPAEPTTAVPSPSVVAPQRPPAVTSRAEPRPRKPVSVWLRAEANGKVTAISGPEAWDNSSGMDEDQLIQLGAYTSARQAEDAWTKMVERFPLLEGMPKTVVPIRVTRARRTLYRLRLGAETQEQAKLACQILKLDGRNCVVVG